jgi:hypothetical protein
MRPFVTVRAAGSVLGAVCLWAAAPPGAATAPPVPVSLPSMSSQAVPAGDDPYAIFERVREARSESGYPQYAVYAAVVRFSRGGQAGVDTWDTVEDLRRRMVFSHAISREEQANPYVPHGINFGIGITGLSSGAGGGGGGDTKVLNAPKPDDPIGQVTLAVDQDFGLALNAPSITQTADAGEVSRTVRTLPHIGRTGAVARLYEVTLLGSGAENGATVQHLGLKPLRDPHRNRLRELWVDAKTALPVRAIVAGIANRAPLDEIRWRVDFTQNEGGTYVAQETALDPLDYGGDGTLNDVSITFAELHPKNILTPQEALGLASSIGLSDP